jgi:hypothetical protein
MSSSSFISAQLEVVGSEKSLGSTTCVFLRVCMAAGRVSLFVAVGMIIARLFEWG